ncbi:hypothetical protein AYI96_10890 [Shewanella sp. MSW]|nr:hypothetical protein AYI96_10890 [Shewanella sp. MSW]
MSNITFPIVLWEGFEAVHTEQNQQTLIIHLKPIDNGYCACGKPAKAVHDASLHFAAYRNEPYWRFRFSYGYPSAVFFAPIAVSFGNISAG